MPKVNYNDLKIQRKALCMHAALFSVIVIFMTLNNLELFLICPHPIVQPHSEPRPRWKRNELVMAAVYGQDKTLNLPVRSAREGASPDTLSTSSSVSIALS